MKNYNIDWIVEYKLFLFAASILIFARSLFFWAINNQYRFISDCSWLARVSSIEPFNTFGKGVIRRQINTIYSTGKNSILDSFIKSSSPSKYVEKFSISGFGKQDIFRDIIVLKSPSMNEKGVILLKYAQTFEAFLYFFNIRSLLDKYYFVLEPCWAGLCNSNILMWLLPPFENRIIIQCYTQDDYDFIASLKPGLIPVKLGPADWVNSEKFKPIQGVEKLYDIVMVANWDSKKNHKKLFQALQKIHHKKINVLLIGYPWGGRTSQDIQSEATTIDSKLINITILENLTHRQVVKHLSTSKIFIFLTRKEGDNKALVEAMFTGVPVIVYKYTIGGASSRVNRDTGILSDYNELHTKIIYMLENYRNFNPRDWALKHTGSNNSTKKLNMVIKELSQINNENFTVDIAEKINTPNLAYKNEQDRSQYDQDYKYILSQTTQ